MRKAVLSRISNQALLKLNRSPAPAAGQSGAQGPGATPPSVDKALRAPAASLDGGTRAFMEQRFGHDFGDVRVHTGGEAAGSAQAIDAQAYTVGRDIVFGDGHYAPHNDRGRKLIAHELTHVVQQSGGASRAVHRAGNDGAAPPAATPAPAPAAAGQSAPSGLSAMLVAHADEIDRMIALSKPKIASAKTAGPDATGVPAESDHYLATAQDGVARMRAIAGGSDEALKKSVLAAFNPAVFHQAEGMMEDPGADEAPIDAAQAQPPAVAKKSLAISQPQDAAEVEAERVSEAVLSGGAVAIGAAPSDGTVSRQTGAEAFSAAGAWVLAADAEAAPVEATNPIGWGVALGAAVVGLALIGTGYILMSSAGNVADTGIMGEVADLIAAAKAAGAALSICEALDQLMAAAGSDSKRKMRIKATQKAKGCRHSRHS
jgi:hypothetical protein